MPIQARAKELEANPGTVTDILAEGARRARRVAGETMREVRAKMGFLAGEQD